MNILVVGGGGREHAIIKKLKQSKKCGKIYAAPGNGGIAKDAECVNIKADDISGMVNFAEKQGIDYVVVAPDDPLVLGMVDALAQKGIPAFGPNAAAARIEGSKAFSKDLMKRYKIPTAAFESFTDMHKAFDYIENMSGVPIVVKADGLALGKGVIIAETKDEAKAAVRSMMEEKRFGNSGNCVVIEEFLTGPEVSVLAFCDGKMLVPMVSSMDHKRALTGNLGLNTGGMGTIAPNPHYNNEISQICMQTIFLPTVEAMIQEGSPFKGCLYFGIMLTPKGPMVIEYNCRFGDPETQVVLPLLQTDLLDIFTACTNGTLSADMVKFSDGSAACVIMASGGYPQSYKSGYEICGLSAAEDSGAVVFHSGTKLEGDKILTSGGRVLGVTATAQALDKAIEKAYAAVEKISFADAYFRTDIGSY